MPTTKPNAVIAKKILANVAGAAAALFVVVAAPGPAVGQQALQPGEAFVTKFSGTTTVAGAGGPRTVIDLAGTVGTAIDLRQPGFPADGRHWLDEPHVFSVTAGDVGQVFGVTLDDANPPNIYLTATSAFGLHRNTDSSGWMDGMWGPGGGPGTVYRLNAANDYRPEIFTDITLDGRANSGAGLGNIAFDKAHHQLFVSDLETGLIHRVALADGAELGRYDHGVTGRGSFVDAGGKPRAGAGRLRPGDGGPGRRLPERRFRARAILLEFCRFPPPRVGTRRAARRRQRCRAALLCGVGQPGLRQSRLADGRRGSAEFGLVGRHRR